MYKNNHKTENHRSSNQIIQSKKRTIEERLERIEQLLSAQTPKPLTLSEASIYLGLSTSYLYRLTSQSRIPFFKPSGKKIYFSKSDLDAYLLNNRSATTEEIETCSSELE